MQMSIAQVICFIWRGKNELLKTDKLNKITKLDTEINNLSKVKRQFSTSMEVVSTLALLIKHCSQTLHETIYNLSVNILKSSPSIFYPLLNILLYTCNTVLTGISGLMHTGTDLPQPTAKHVEMNKVYDNVDMKTITLIKYLTEIQRQKII